MGRFRATRWLATAVAFTLFLGCGPKPDENSGGDEKKAKAGVIKLGEPAHDRVDRPGGDSTDWKRFAVDVYETDLTLRIWWDNPNVRATVTLYDMFGSQLYALTHKIGERKESWGNIRIRKGEYFVKVTASSAESVYTLELKTADMERQEAPPPVNRPF